MNLTDSSNIPDIKTIRLLRDRLAQAGVGDQIFEQLQQQLSRRDYLARCGQIIDALPVVADTTVFEALLDAGNTSRNVHADR